MAKKKPQTFADFTNHCRRGIAVFTTGVDLDLSKLSKGKIKTKQWPANPKRIAVGDCMVVFHRTSQRPYRATVYVGKITTIEHVMANLYEYTLADTVVHTIEDVNWSEFIGGGRYSVRYFPVHM